MVLELVTISNWFLGIFAGALENNRKVNFLLELSSDFYGFWVGARANHHLQLVLRDFCWGAREKTSLLSDNLWLECSSQPPQIVLDLFQII